MLAVALAAVAASSASGAGRRTPSPSRAPAPAPLRFGVTTPGGPLATAELDQVARISGEQPSVVLWYADFTTEAPVDALHAVQGRGATPLITWEPWRAGGGVNQPGYALARIASGAHDAYLRRWARALRSFGGPVMLRFAHEMNGDWCPWSEAVNGNRPSDYVAAWRHVHAVFSAAGASNVTWVWSPNVVYPGSTPLTGLFPGDDVVDVVAIDGYNWGTTRPGMTWTTPADLFGPTLAQARTVAPGKPLMIAETASAEAGGSKAAWIQELFTWLRTQPDVRTVVWFHHQKETDWRIDSSPGSAAAFAAGLAAWRR
jgi:beta-mannanase